MLKNQSLNFTSKPELFLLISASILVFLAGSLLLLIFFGAVVFGVFWKEKIRKAIDLIARQTSIFKSRKDTRRVQVARARKRPFAL